ncbi:MAG: trypsin-like serine protease, partial [Acidobacteria bacterium]|nr:trypsin-like serine protease [Acidobacteriota bacterium]
MAVATAGVIRHDVPLSLYRDLARQSDFMAVGRHTDSPESDDYAAGVLVAPGWVLTAAHFVGEASFWTFGEQQFRGIRVIRHPKLEPGATETQWTGWDMALVELDRPVTSIKPAERYRGRAEVGQVVTKVGYGYQGDGENGLRQPPTQLRLAGQNVIEAAGGELDGREFTTDVLVFDFDGPGPDAPNPLGSPDPLPLEIGGSKGDSGGGVFLQDGGAWKLAGIVSGAM